MRTYLENDVEGSGDANIITPSFSRSAFTAFTSTNCPDTPVQSVTRSAAGRCYGKRSKATATYGISKTMKNTACSSD